MKKLNKLIEEYVKARINASWIGARDIEDHPEIKQWLKETKEALNKELEKHENCKPIGNQ